jgi:hypothetical protein
MAMTQLTLLLLAALATLATVGMLLDLDRDTQMIIPFLAAILWAFEGLAAWDVIVSTEVVNGDIVTVSEPILPLVYLGIGMAMATASYGIWYLMEGVAKQSDDAFSDSFEY